MKLQVRQMPNGQWIVEGRRLGIWRGLRVGSIATRHSAAMNRDLPSLCIEKPGNVHYPLCWHVTKDSAEDEMREVMSLLGTRRAAASIGERGKG